MRKTNNFQRGIERLERGGWKMDNAAKAEFRFQYSQTFAGKMEELRNAWVDLLDELHKAGRTSWMAALIWFLLALAGAEILKLILNRLT